MALKLKYRGYDNLLPSQGYGTPQEAVIDECGKWWNDD
jgi:hypothetical protein